MPLEIIRNDITKVQVDAIVNAANTSLLGGGGVDGAIHRTAGPELLEECRELRGCKVGQAKITKGYKLPSKYVIHTVGPVWNGGKKDEEKLLEACYKNSLELAKRYNLESIAFPLISTGAYRYPKDKAIKVAISVIGEFLLSNEMDVFLVVFDNTSFMLSEKLFSSIKQYIDDNYIEEHPIESRRRIVEDHLREEYIGEEPVLYSMEAPLVERNLGLIDEIDNMEDTFSQKLLKLIDDRGMTDSETYKKANIDRKLFSKIRNDANYKPSKATAIAFAIALKLNLKDTEQLLLSAGFALSNSSKFDIIIKFFIEKEIYNIFEINEALFDFKQNLLGGR